MTREQWDSITSPRVYLVYFDDDGDGPAQHVIAKNREDAKTKVSFPFTHVAYRPWIKLIDGKFVDRYGNEYKNRLTGGV
jgi:hypothetical protein